jgi:hypothetical protein
MDGSHTPVPNRPTPLSTTARGPRGGLRCPPGSHGCFESSPVPSLGTPARPLAAGHPLESAFGHESTDPLKDHVASAPRAGFLIKRRLDPKLIGSIKDRRHPAQTRPRLRTLPRRSRATWLDGHLGLGARAEGSRAIHGLAASSASRCGCVSLPSPRPSRRRRRDA